MKWVRVGFGLSGVVAVAVGAVVADAWTAFGAGPDDARRARMTASRQWGDGTFVNPQPMWNDVVGSITGIGDMSPVASPSAQLPVVTGGSERFATPPSDGLRVTWLGHSTQVLEIDGTTVITDPIFGGRASPVTWAGPEVWYAPPIPLDQLPDVDAVLISHDHYDHLQVETIQAMAGWDTTFVTPLGVGAHLAYWGVPESRIIELDWWERTQVGTLDIVATPSRHASGRHVLDQNRTLWAGYALLGPEHRVFFSGDTGLFPGLEDIGRELGPFDVTFFEVGAYNRAWPDWHLGPENALRAHEMVRGELFVPIHWGLWNLASHGWTEPAERVVAEARRLGVTVALPRPGQSFGLDDPPTDAWWPDVAWETVEQHPIRPTGLE